MKVAIPITLLSALWAFPVAAQTVERVDDFNPGGRGAGPYELVLYQGAFYFQADSGTQGRELMRYDGSRVAVAADIRPGADGSAPSELTVHDGMLYFTADNGVSGRRLWSFDGTTATLVDSAGYVSTAQELISFGGKLCFRGVRFGDVGIELFTFDGTTISAIDILPGTGSSYPQHMKEYAGVLYFNAAGALGQGNELWRYDGSSVMKAGAEIRSGSGSAPASLAVHEGQLYFSANDGVNGNELWRFDGTNSSLAADIDPNGNFGSSNPSAMASYAAALYFCANDGGGAGNELYRFDGTVVEMVANINPNPPGAGGDDFLADSNPSGLTVYDGLLYFIANDGAHGEELWACDGTSCHMVADIRSMDSYGSNASGLDVVDGKLYLIADSGEGFGLELYRVGFIASGVLPNFGTITIPPTLSLNGAGTNIDSIAFWEAPDPADTRMFVTGKGNDVVEVWKFPFAGNELPAILFPANVNGVAVDQETDILYVTDRIVSVFLASDLTAQGTFGSGTIGVGENNVDILKHSNGQTWIYVSEDHNVHRFDAATNTLLGSFAPPVSSIETVLADDFYQMILVAEEQGPEGYPGIYAYHPDGTPFEKNGTNRFGNDGEFDSDEEGMLLYTFPANGVGDNGTGFIVVSDQRSDVTEFEFFDRQTWAHLGALRLTGVSNTDGIASTQRALPGYPLGVFAAIDNDTATVIVGWDTIFAALGWDIEPETSFEAWASSHDLDSGFDSDPDGDGDTNLMEFATDGDPLSGSDSGKSSSGLMTVGDDTFFAFTLAVRDGAVFSGTPLTATVDGIVYSVGATSDLTAFDQGLVEMSPPLSSGMPALSDGWSYRTFRMEGTLEVVPRCFVRLGVGLER
jgi:ELWxxDGT repeat protein